MVAYSKVPPLKLSGCPPLSPGPIDKTIQNITQKAAGSMALLEQIKEPLPNTAFDQLPDEEKMQYLELAGHFEPVFLVKFGQYSQIAYRYRSI